MNHNHDMSTAEKLALLPPAERKKLVARYDPRALATDASFWMRPSTAAALRADLPPGLGVAGILVQQTPSDPRPNPTHLTVPRDLGVLRSRT